MELRVIEGGLTSPTGGGCHASGCGGSADGLAHLPRHIREKVQDHPCFSEEAHHHYARMHVAVAPACNIQCHYCNRKYDCANESRPGVVSELLTPEQAVKKTLAVAAAIPQLSVLGIAGPGDPLANPERTFATLRALSEQAPDIKLCLSTNGLTLPDLVEEICRYRIEHVTITINCLDPAIGAKIYPWIFWRNRRIRGLKAAGILIEQQQKGLEMLCERGVLVKVNSVMIPGVNDAHLAEVSRVVKSKGAFLHNVMPLIAAPEHGTFYGLMGQRGPTQDELESLQDACSGDMRMMRHCRHCGADAFGLLGEDRRDDFSLERIEHQTIDYAAAMRRRAEVHAAIESDRHARSSGSSQTRIPLAALTRSAPTPAARSRTPGAAPSRPTHWIRVAVASASGELIDTHFGHAREFLIYEAAAPEGRVEVRRVDRREVEPYCSGPARCGETASRLSLAIQALTGCAAVLCSQIGIEPWGALESAGILPSGEHALEPIEDAVALVYRELAAAGRLHPFSEPAARSA